MARIERPSVAVLIFIIFVSLASLTLSRGALAQTADTPKLKLRTKPDADVRYRIGPGDVLEVHVFNRPNLSRDRVRVDGDGMIRLDLLGSMKAACLSESELADQISKRYAEYLKEPQVDVFIKEFSSQPAVVNGAVGKPGTFQLQRLVRLRELLLLAGGPTPSAGPMVQIIHDEGRAECQASVQSDASGPTDAEVIPLKELLSARGASDPYIRPGDFVNVPEASVAYVVGNVYKPTPISLGSNVTVSTAIAMAGGTLPNSKGDVRLLRASSGSNGTRELLINIKQLQNHEGEDITLRPGDIVEVQLSTAKAFLKQFFLWTATNAASSTVVYSTVTAIK